MDKAPSALDEMLQRYQLMPEDQQAALLAAAQTLTGEMRWLPNPGPQTEALFNPADLLFYGGQGGGSKSDLLLGTALTQHRRSLLMRRQYADLSALTERAVEINGTRLGFKETSPPRLRSIDGRLLEFGAAQREGKELAWQGRPHDFLGVDEVVQFLEKQIRFLMGWVRTTVQGQRCRTILASNAPINAAQRWIIGMFRPWLDLTYDKPAKPGELRWFVTAPDGKDLEVPDATPVQLPGQTKPLIPQSRTFIPAALSDNPFLSRTNYQATLDALPEPMRSAVRDGDFTAAQLDAENQVIPTAWIIAAEKRWKADGGRRFGAMTCMAFDSAGGGLDAAVLGIRHGPWVDKLDAEAGIQTADGGLMATRILGKRRDGAPIVLDVGGGFASGVILRLKDNEIVPHKFNGAEKSSATAKGSGLHFVNKRAEVYWKLAEALDPGQPNGAVLELPPDPELRADLAAVTWSLELGGIQIGDKDDIRAKLGRSPGKGDVVAMLVSEGTKAAQRQAGGMRGRKPKVIMGHDRARRR